jgi:hypothetical protein
MDSFLNQLQCTRIVVEIAGAMQKEADSDASGGFEEQRVYRGVSVIDRTDPQYESGVGLTASGDVRAHTTSSRLS